MKWFKETKMSPAKVQMLSTIKKSLVKFKKAKFSSFFFSESRKISWLCLKYHILSLHLPHLLLFSILFFYLGLILVWGEWGGGVLLVCFVVFNAILEGV